MKEKNLNVAHVNFICLVFNKKLTSPPTFVSVPWTWLADDLSANEQLVGPHASGVNSILPKEHGSQFFYLPIIKHSDEEVIDPYVSL